MMMIPNAREDVPESSADPRPEDAFQTLAELEALHIARALAVAGANQRLAARLLGITRWSLARRVRKYGLEHLLVASAELVLGGTTPDD